MMGAKLFIFKRRNAISAFGACGSSKAVNAQLALFLLIKAGFLVVHFASRWMIFSSRTKPLPADFSAILF